MWSIITKILIILLGIFVLFSLWALVFVYAMYQQEKKAYRKVHILRSTEFSYKWIYGSLWGILFTIPTIIKHRSLSKVEVRNKALQCGQKLGQWMMRSIFSDPEIIGKENVPKDDDTAVIYIVNHQSMIDIAMLYFVDRRFAWVSKSAAFMIPGIGCFMRLSQFISLKRGDRSSVVKMFDGCIKSMESNCSVAIFPQGTRERHEILPFKDGAFQLAIDHKFTLIPVTIYLPEDIWFNNKKKCSLTIHKPLPPTEDLAELKQKAFAVITSALPYAKKDGKQD